MRRKKKRFLFSALFLLLIGITINFVGGIAASIGIPIILFALFFLFIFFRASLENKAEETPDNNKQSIDFNQIKAIENNINQETETITVNVLGSDYRKEQWKEIEKVIDSMLDTCLKIMESRFDANTIAIFFPNETGDGYKIRKYISKSDCINSQAVIYPGKGVLGSFIKNGLKQLNLHDIVSDSMTLHYYTRDAGIRSLIASPIITEDGVERGTIIIDSTKPKNFSDHDHSYLSLFARFIGQCIYYVYISNIHKLEHQRIAAMSSIEKDFFQNPNLDAILDRMLEIIRFAIPCDRITLSLLNTDKNSATIRRVWGINAEKFNGITFSLKEKSLASILYSKNMVFFRNFAEDHIEIRYCKEEPDSENMKSFLAIPLGINQCIGGIILESTRKDAFFSASNRELLRRITTSAGLAIEKQQLIEQKHNLATHDGLTLLINHREFQEELKKAITRALRYNEPLSLVLCDIDHFKKINDTFGHPFGDLILKEVASKLRENIRDGVDVAARYGGEEFALILAKTDGKMALETVERIRQNIYNSTFKDTHGKDLKISMSFGIAVYGEHAKQLDLLISKADKALYRAKENGRNRVEIYLQ